MNQTEMNIRFPHTRCRSKKVSAILTLAALCFLLSASNVFAQKTFSKTYPARKNIRIHLSNQSGPITVEGWDKDQIKISAEIESSSTRFTPQISSEELLIDVVRDNQGRSDVGSINFKIWVPVNSKVDIETLMGDLSVNNVQGSLVRAHITSEGNISLTRIRSPLVMAGNVSGDILFDGELLSGGIYTLKSTAGSINIRIPENSQFSLVAAAPTREITLGSFSQSGLSFIGDRRKVIGKVGDASASLSVTNQRGSISFIRRQ